jgi:hypothetical protein
MRMIRVTNLVICFSFCHCANCWWLRIFGLPWVLRTKALSTFISLSGGGWLLFSSSLSNHSYNSSKSQGGSVKSSRLQSSFVRYLQKSIQFRSVLELHIPLLLLIRSHHDGLDIIQWFQDIRLVGCSPHPKQHDDLGIIRWSRDIRIHNDVGWCLQLIVQKGLCRLRLLHSYHLSESDGGIVIDYPSCNRYHQKSIW